MEDTTTSTEPVRFECTVMKGFHGLEKFVTDDEATALEWSRQRTSIYVDQVTIEATRLDHLSTFAIRHLGHPDQHDRPVDTGWSCWLDGDKVSTRSIEVLFADRPSVSVEGAA